MQRHKEFRHWKEELNFYCDCSEEVRDDDYSCALVE
jgi:hypothetical protein